MFKIAKLDNTNEEKVTINYTDYKLQKDDSFKTLSFNIAGIKEKDEYNFSFTLNCKPEELLNIKESETINLKSYLFESEIFFTFNKTTDLEPLYDIKICRWLGNKFVVSINFYSKVHTAESNIYSGMIEFEFNLDDYLEC